MNSSALKGGAAGLLICGILAGVFFAAHSGAADAVDSAAADGRLVYTQICQGCHMPQGQGAEGAGHYPALSNNPALVSWQYMAITILNGRRNMPAFSAKHAPGPFYAPVVLNDAQIAAVINYVRTHFGNDFKDAATAEGVHALDR
jgi:mono/diheme cytochrome c family protein